jgi:hypothetical protein
VQRIKGANLIWKFADQKVNRFGPAHIEKSHFKGISGCIFRQSLMKYGGNKSIKDNSLRPWVLIPEDNRHSTVTRKIPFFSVEPSPSPTRTIEVHWFLSVKYFTCKNYLDWDIFRYFYFFTKYIALLSLIKDEVLLTVSCPIFLSILIAKNLLTGSLKIRSIDNLETQNKSISMKNSQFFDYLLYAKSK